ncbi:hypothetical protein [Leadbettera azotonutricia]|uniref:Trep n=1 Tax=Leadbettera azotonutricia (strain ATCC BAA-888 / DSM 13862 / ZAS-9) TaxID=545695 RepID=F5YCK2_LEAAZ|nr:hypothetical protein [Leadbettera azotonutricia]AEF82450.1 trep [Leadbettera azotonutricia ZAS-9]
MYLRRLLISLSLCLLGAVSVSAQNFKPFILLRAIKTEHFEIIYPAESEATARALSLFADQSYKKASKLLGITVKDRIPVAITPHTDEFNGYMNPLPYPHIVLFDTPMDPEWTAYENSLESLFFHELTHAISLSSRGKGFQVLHTIFGGWVYPTGLTAPMFMVEGVTVSFESLEGFGRANDPLIKEKLSQAVHEDNFLTGFQASGIYEYPPQGNAYYDYGGLFSAWLQKTYGMEKYAGLWKDMGTGYHFSFWFYNNGFYYSFKKIYGLSFEEAWNVFKESWRLEGIKKNNDGFVYGGNQKDKVIINAVTSDSNSVIFIDSVAEKVLKYNPTSAGGSGGSPGAIKKLASIDSSAYDIDATNNGSFLISSYRYGGNLSQAMVTEYSGNGNKTGRTWPGLYHGRFFREGAVGISSDRHTNNLVYRSKPGKKGEEILLKGNAELLYSRPSPIDDEWIAFIALKKGKRELCLFNYDTRQAYTLVSALDDNENIWRYMRGLSYSEGRLLFSYNHNDRMYKLGVIILPANHSALNESSITAVLSNTDFSGGIFLPVLLNGDIYYRGAFSTWDAIMKYPDEAESLREAPLAISGLHLEPWPEEDSIAAGLRQIQPPVQQTPREPSAGEQSADSKLYFPLKYLNPFKLWIPLPLLRRHESSISIDGGGFFSFMADPADTNFIFLSAYMDARNLMGVFDLQWTNRSLGFPLQITFSDDMDRSWEIDYRRTQGTITAIIGHGLGGELVRLNFQAGIGMAWFAFDPEDGSSAYTWEYETHGSSLIFGIELTSLKRSAWELFGSGFSAAFYSRFSFPEAAPRYEGLFKAAFDPFPLRFGFYGVWDSDGLNLAGYSRSYDTSLFAPIASTEYSSFDSSGFKWMGGGEIEWRLFSVDIKKNLSHVYYNRIFGSLAYRGAFYDSKSVNIPQGNPLWDDYRLAQSAVLRFGAALSTVFVTALPVTVKPELWGAFKISGAQNGIGWNDFAWGIYVSAEL